MVDTNSDEVEKEKERYYEPHLIPALNFIAHITDRKSDLCIDFSIFYTY